MRGTSDTLIISLVSCKTGGAAAAATRELRLGSQDPKLESRDSKLESRDWRASTLDSQDSKLGSRDSKMLLSFRSALQSGHGVLPDKIGGTRAQRPDVESSDRSACSPFRASSDSVRTAPSRSDVLSQPWKGGEGARTGRRKHASSAGAMNLLAATTTKIDLSDEEAKQHNRGISLLTSTTTHACIASVRSRKEVRAASQRQEKRMKMALQRINYLMAFIGVYAPLASFFFLAVALHHYGLLGGIVKTERAPDSYAEQYQSDRSTYSMSADAMFYLGLLLNVFYQSHATKRI